MGNRHRGGGRRILELLNVDVRTLLDAAINDLRGLGEGTGLIEELV